MSASVHGEGARAGLRWVLVGVTVFDLLAVLLILLVQPAPDVRVAWTPAWLFTIVDRTWPVVVLLAVATIGVIGFARGKRSEPWFLALLLIAMALLVEVLGAWLGSHHRRYYSVGAALTGWLIGLVYGRLRGADQARSERLAEAGAAAALAATYFDAGLQKLLAGGLFEVHSMQAHILSHHPIDDASPIGALTRFVALDSSVAAGFGVVTVIVQVGALAYLVGPRMRMVWGTLLIGFHLGTLVFLNLIYIEATVLLLAWSYPWARIVARRRGASRPSEPASRELDDPPVAGGELALLGGVTVLLIGVAWVVPTPHELPQSDPGRHDPPPDHADRGGDHDRGPGNTVDRLGPLRVGDRLDAWEIESIEIARSDARVHVARGSDRASFGFSGPAGSAPEGPFSVGDLHVYYDAEVASGELQGAGEALRDALRADHDDPGAQVDAWIERARASLPTPDPSNH
ncbi:hypothetical protein ACNOYE_06750 [Nannocystaceae bacterium ST9]